MIYPLLLIQLTLHRVLVLGMLPSGCPPCNRLRLRPIMSQTATTLYMNPYVVPENKDQYRSVIKTFELCSCAICCGSKW